MNKHQAILLLGPTGSGKTPLGELLQARGLGTTRCLHFDFGERLRQIANRRLKVAELTTADLAFIAEVLHRGALLENEHFHIAEKVLRAFLAESHAGSEVCVVLNGLPRHVGQADDVGRIVAIRAVVELSCTPATVLARLSADTGGDRAGRTDDDPARVERKLELYAARTEALLDHYQGQGAEVITVNVGPGTTADEIHRDLQERNLGQNPNHPQ